MKKSHKRPVVDGRIILKWMYNEYVGWECVGWITLASISTVGWIHRAQDKDKWRTLVNTTINLGVSLNAGNFLTS
jgi:hypothetical protein